LEISTIDDIELKHGEFGPGYLSRTGDAAIGLLVLRPGDTYRNHIHPQAENSFLVTAGTAELWIDGTRRIEMAPGTFVRCDAGEAHYFRNLGSEVWRAVFVRCPYDPDDTVDVPWEPPETG
jgi:quercetin dioxygenase-like cupin family protein